MEKNYKRMVFALPYLVFGIILANSEMPYYGLTPYVKALGLLLLLASAAVIIYNFILLARKK